MLSHFSRIRLWATLWTAAHQVLLSTGFSRQEYWSGLPFIVICKNQQFYSPLPLYLYLLLNFFTIYFFLHCIFIKMFLDTEYFCLLTFLLGIKGIYSPLLQYQSILNFTFTRVFSNAFLLLLSILLFQFEEVPLSVLVIQVQ